MTSTYSTSVPSSSSSSSSSACPSASPSAFPSFSFPSFHSLFIESQSWEKVEFQGDPFPKIWCNFAFRLHLYRSSVEEGRATPISSSPSSAASLPPSPTSSAEERQLLLVMNGWDTDSEFTYHPYWVFDYGAVSTNVVLSHPPFPRPLLPFLSPLSLIIVLSISIYFSRLPLL